MPDRTLYHIDEQYARALLLPMVGELAVLEARAAHYLDHLRLPDTDRALLETAQEALTRAREELDRLTGAARAAQRARERARQ